MFWKLSSFRKSFSRNLNFLKSIAAVQEWFLNKDHFDAVLAITDTDLVKKDEKFDSEINTAVEKTPTNQYSFLFLCNLYDKFYSSKGGLTRYTNLKRKKSLTVEHIRTTKDVEDLLLLELFYFMLLKSTVKL